MKKEREQVEKLCYTLDEFCTATGLSRSHWNREIRAGRLPVIKEGSRVLITAAVAKQRFASNEAAQDKAA